jgi:hypothetical protein
MVVWFVVGLDGGVVCGGTPGPCVDRTPSLYVGARSAEAFRRT